MTGPPTDNDPTIDMSPRLQSVATLVPVRHVLRPPELPGYEIHEWLGQGGCGVVYRARHLHLNRIVAVKLVLAGSFAGPTELVRFRQEAELVARLQHPNIVQVFEVGAHAGHSYLTLEYVDGGSLAHKAAGQPQPPRWAARVVELLAEAVEFAHRNGVLHRDIKPGNVMLTADGAPKLTDFGLARPLNDSDGMTATGAILGSPGFMAPEQAEAKRAAVGPATDVFALGAVLYDLLTGRPPFQGPTHIDVIRQTIEKEPTPPSRLRPDTPRDLETICLKCLHKEPARRYASAAELADDLRRYLADEPIRARPVGTLERVGRWARRNPAVAGLLSAVAALLVLVAVGSTFAAVRLKGGRDRAEQAERQSRLREADAHVSEARALRISRKSGQRFATLAALAKAVRIGRELGQPAEWYDRIRTEAIAALSLPDAHITQEWEGFPPGSVDADFTDDFELYARTDERGGCSIRRVADDVEVVRLPDLGEAAKPTFGRGRTLAIYSNSWPNVRLWDVGGQAPALRWEARHRVHAVNFRDDGKLLTLAHADGRMTVVDVERAATAAELPPSEINAGLLVAMHPSAPVVVVWSFLDRQLLVRHSATGTVVARVRLEWNPTQCFWSRDGSTLVANDGEHGRLKRWEFDAKTLAFREGRPMPRPPLNGGVGAFRPDDALIAFVSTWHPCLCLYDTASDRVTFTSPHYPGLAAMRWDRTGQRFAAARFGDRIERLGIWSVDAGHEVRVLRNPGDGIGIGYGTPAIHPDGRLAARSGNDLVLFDLATNRPLARAAIPGGCGCVAFADDGTLVTNGFGGCYRWPVRRDPADPNRVTVGPPEVLPMRPSDREIAASRDASVIAQCMWMGYGMEQHAGGWVLHPNAAQPRRVHEPSSNLTSSVSPDGRWVAFGTGDIRVFDAASGEPAWQPTGSGGGAWCRFTRDGRWLVTDHDQGRVYAVGTWQPGPQLGAGQPTSITADGRFVIQMKSGKSCRLVELATGRELARFDELFDSDNPVAFSPDGTRLVAACAEGLRVWDLRLIRERLRAMGLDWDAPDFPPPVPPTPLAVAVVGLELIDPTQRDEIERTRSLVRLACVDPFDVAANVTLGKRCLADGRPEAAVSHFTFALAASPDNLDALEYRAKGAVRLKRWDDAIADATRYLRLRPDGNGALAVRAAAYLGAARHAEAIDDLTALLTANAADVGPLLERADCYDALGQADQAKADRERASRADPMTANNRAWRLVTGRREDRDPARALRLAEIAFRGKPDEAMILNTLGAVQYHNGLYDKALATLDASLRAGRGKHDGHDLFFQAMCHARLGDAAKSREVYERAVAWTEAKKDISAQHRRELNEFRADADAELRRLPSPDQ